MEPRRKRQKSMGFKVVECSRCKASRVLGQPCAECDLKPRLGEVNSLVVQRRTAVARIQRTLNYQHDTKDEGELGLPSREELEQYLNDFVDALGGLITDPIVDESITEMVEAERQLRNLKRRCSARPRLRPTIALHEAISKVIAHFSELWPTYIEALQAPALDEAQRLASLGQDKINAASDELANYDSLVESTRAYEDLTIPDLLDRSINALAISYPGLDLRSLDRYGSQEAERLIGMQAQAGYGAQFLILNAVGSVHFDPGRLHLLLREASRVCADDSQLSEVASQPAALEGLATSSRLAYEAWEMFESILSRVKDDDALMRRAIKFYGEIYEDVASPILAWYNLIAGIKAQPYAKLIQEDATVLARSLTRQERTALLLQDDGASLRHASQHGSSYTLDGQDVVFRLRSYQETLSRAEIMDRIFSFVESVLAMNWSLLNALARLGVEVPVTEDDTKYMNLTPFRLATLWLEGKKSQLVDAAESATAWTFAMEIEREDVLSMALAFAQYLPEKVSDVTVRMPGTQSSLLVPFEAFEQFAVTSAAATAPVDHLMAIVEIRGKCMIGGDTILTESDLKYAAGSIGLFILKKNDFSLLPSLRKVHRLSVDHSARAVISIVKKIFALTRSPNVAEVLQLEVTLKAWTERPAPTVPTCDAVTVRK